MHSFTSVAADYYVAKTGGGSTCSLASPCLTIAAGLAKLTTAGDNLYIRVGTYSEQITSSQLATNGTDWGSGAITVQGYPGDTVTLTGSSVLIAMAAPSSGSKRYFIFKNLALSGGSASVGGGGLTGAVDHIKFDNVRVSNAPQACFYLGAENNIGNTNWIANSSANGCKTSGPAENQWHGVYVTSGNNIIEDTEIQNVPNGFGIHGYNGAGGNSANNIYRRNRIHGIGVGNDTSSLACAIMGDGGNNQFFNNLCYDAQQGVVPIYSGSAVIANNTFYNIGTNAGAGCISGGSGVCWAIDLHNTSNPRIQNNIVWGLNSASAITTTGATGTILNTNNTTTNPNFQNAAAGDFHLTSLSSAQINTGADLSAFFTTDYANTTRTVPFDIGAYKYAAPTPPVNQLVLALSLDEGVGSTAIDVSGQKNNATLIGGATWDNTGVFGKAIMFDGAGYLNIPASRSLALAPAMTLEAWVYPTVALSTFGALIFQDQYYLYGASDSGYCPAPAFAPGGGYSSPTGENYVCATSLPPVNQWSHLAVTHDGVTTVFYLNGNVIASKTSTIPMVATSANVMIGASTFGENFIGKMDQPMVYNYARTRPQILSDMSTSLIGAPGKYVEIAAPASVEISSASLLEISAD